MDVGDGKWGEKVLFRDDDERQGSFDEVNFAAIPRDQRNFAASVLAENNRDSSTYSLLGRHRWHKEDGAWQDSYDMSDLSEEDKESGRRRERELREQAFQLVQELQDLQEEYEHDGGPSIVKQQQAILQQIEQLAAKSVLAEQYQRQYQRQKLSDQPVAVHDPMFRYQLNKRQRKHVTSVPVASHAKQEAAISIERQPLAFAAAGAFVGLAIPGIVSRLFSRCTNKLARKLLGTLVIVCAGGVSWQLCRPPPRRQTHGDVSQPLRLYMNGLQLANASPDRHADEFSNNQDAVTSSEITEEEDEDQDSSEL